MPAGPGMNRDNGGSGTGGHVHFIVARHTKGFRRRILMLVNVGGGTILQDTLSRFQVQTIERCIVYYAT
jgi:hypothetical protein